jgi:hypothetical protein
MEPLEDLIAPFIDSLASRRTEIHNEFSLQHELGISLREKLPDLKVRFEKNVSSFFSSRISFTKREIDISIFSPDTNELAYAIELKYPRNGQYPEQMFSFCKDVTFAEELCAAGFRVAGLLIFADDRLFYSGSNEGIYGFFRSDRPLKGRIQKPTGSKDTETLLRGNYVVRWKPIVDSLKYAVIEVKRGG